MYSRSLTEPLSQALDSKIVLLSGPRQVGKTTLSRSLGYSDLNYLNLDYADDRKIQRDQSWSRSSELVVFDELHKIPKWKSFIKGIYDKEGCRPRLLVTGSARLEITRRGGESLAGRHRLMRLHPLTVCELLPSMPANESLPRLLKFGGFPEPFQANSEEAYRLWQRSHLDRILRGDLIELENVRDIRKVEILLDLLSERVGSTISYSSLARDLEISPHTVKRWIEILEWLFIIFIVTPHSKNMARALTHEPKIYFYNTGMVMNGEPARFENLVACALLKQLHFLEDTQGFPGRLHYLRDREKREVDFLTIIDRKPELMVEVKVSDNQPSSSLRYFEERIAPKKTIQVVLNCDRSTQHGNLHVQPANLFLSEIG
jgi:predicted AAA+ superfamily ATPase